MPNAGTPRVHYRKNPLIEVTCQLRFPAILKVSSEPPVGFQEHIRNQFPLFGVSPDNGAYHLGSEDRTWQLVLEKGFLAVTTKRYDRWEQFKSTVEAPVSAFCTEYKPAFFSRVGLRFRNLIRRSALGLVKEGWGKLLNAQATGALSWPDFGGDITGTRNEVLIKLNGRNGQVRVIHGLVNVRGMNEPCYLIDNDFFVEGKIEVGDVLGRLDNFHKDARRIFKWWVTEKLHKAMQPETA